MSPSAPDITTTNSDIIVSEKNAHPHPLVPALRASARLLVREFGIMSSTFAGTNLAPSAVHALIEIGSSSSPHSPSNQNKSLVSVSNENGIAGTYSRKEITAAALCAELNLEKSSVSRMLRKLIDGGEVEEVVGARDGREKVLLLTPKGKETLAIINEVGNEQVERALGRLPAGSTPEHVLRGIEAYAVALRSVRVGLGHDVQKLSEKVGEKEGGVRIVEGYRPGLAGRVIEMHMTHYSRLVNFGEVFEAMLATGLGELIPRLDGVKAHVWTAMEGERILGSVFIDGDSKEFGDVEGGGGGKAHFRFFILDENLRGRGVGKTLVERAMKWVDERRLECHLWTFRGLEAARRLYDWAGFVVVEEGSSEKLGREVWVQRLVRGRRNDNAGIEDV